ncbi:MAG: ExeM/NucH family extracellular endonuclease [Opitutae bacterium]|nr:ExeM/NucH family extracellular endonuclease [Opitutae bacterium]
MKPRCPLTSPGPGRAGARALHGSKNRRRARWLALLAAGFALGGGASVAAVPIHTVQGGGVTSAFTGQVQTVDGIVTAAFQGSGGLGGFYVQAAEADYDNDPATSEGIFVRNTTFAASAGDLVRVTGTVAEFGTAPSTQTELASVTAVVRLGAAALPAPVALALPFASTSAAERFEGMRVTFAQRLTLTDTFNLGRFGEITLSNGRLPTPTNVVAPGAAATAQDVANFLNTLVVDDNRSGSFPDPTPFLADSAGAGLTRRTGSTVAGATGVLDERFGNYLLELTAPLVFADENPRAAPPAAAAGTLRVVGANVLNLFNGDGAGAGFPTSRGADTAAEFSRQLAKTVAGLTRLAPDILGLTEIENDGFGPAGALAALVAALNNAAPAGTGYALVDAAAADNGTDLIHVAFVYRTQTVAPVGAPAALTSPYFTGLARPPLAQTFRATANGEVLTISVNHFRAKGSAATSAASNDGLAPNPNRDTGDGQGTNNYLRTRQAQALAQWLATDPTRSGDPDFLILGDLNAYAREDPITALRDAGYTNLTEAHEGAGGYSYAFDGAFGHLDHALANARLATQVVTAVAWHANADEPAFLDYNTESKSAAQQAINVGTPFRFSDHDPVIVDLRLGTTVPPPAPPPPAPAPTPAAPASKGGGGGAPSGWFSAALAALVTARTIARRTIHGPSAPAPARPGAA